MPSAISQLKLLFPPSPPPPSPGAGAVFGLLPPFDHAMTLEMTFGGSWSTGGNEPSTPLPGPPPEATGIFPDSIAKLVVWLADLSSKASALSSYPVCNRGSEVVVQQTHGITMVVSRSAMVGWEIRWISRLQR